MSFWDLSEVRHRVEILSPKSKGPEFFQVRKDWPTDQGDSRKLEELLWIQVCLDYLLVAYGSEDLFASLFSRAVTRFEECRRANHLYNQVCFHNESFF